MLHRRDHNVTRRLTRMLKASGMPHTGGAHWLRMRYVQLTHALLILQGQCTRGRIVMAMRELLEGWADTEEEHYQHRLLNAVDADRAPLAPTRAHASHGARLYNQVCGGVQEFTLCGTAC
jgi:hypothetical protein